MARSHRHHHFVCAVPVQKFSQAARPKRTGSTAREKSKHCAVRSELQIRGNFLTRVWLSTREQLRQPEPWEHAVLEAGHGADAVAGEG